MPECFPNGPQHKVNTRIFPDPIRSPPSNVAYHTDINQDKKQFSRWLPLSNPRSQSPQCPLHCWPPPLNKTMHYRVISQPHPLNRSYIHPVHHDLILGAILHLPKGLWEPGEDPAQLKAVPHCAGLLLYPAASEPDFPRVVWAWGSFCCPTSKSNCMAVQTCTTLISGSRMSFLP